MTVDENGAATPGAMFWVGIGLALLLGLTLLVVQVYLISTQGQTIGKKIVGVRIVRLDNSPAGFVNGFLLRYFVAALPLIIPLLNIFYFFTDYCFIFRADRRCLHDLIAGTKVVKA